GDEITVREEVDGIAKPHRRRVIAVVPGKFLDRVVTQIHQQDWVSAAAAIMSPKTCLQPIRKKDSRKFFISQAVAVGGIRGTEGPRHRQWLRKATINTDCP